MTATLPPGRRADRLRQNTLDGLKLVIHSNAQGLEGTRGRVDLAAPTRAHSINRASWAVCSQDGGQ